MNGKKMIGKLKEYTKKIIIIQRVFDVIYNYIIIGKGKNEGKKRKPTAGDWWEDQQAAYAQIRCLENRSPRNKTCESHKG